MDNTLTLKNLVLLNGDLPSPATSFHSRVLVEKRDEFQRLLNKRKHEYEGDIQKLAEKYGNSRQTTPRDMDISQSNTPTQDDTVQQINTPEMTEITSSAKNMHLGQNGNSSSGAPGSSLSNTSTDTQASLRIDNARSRRQRELDELQEDLQIRLYDLQDRFRTEASTVSSTPQGGGKDSVWGRAMSPDGVSTDSLYLVHSVGEALRHAVSQLCLTHPADPIETLAYLLYSYAENKTRRQNLMRAVHVTKQEAVERLKTLLAREEEAMRLDKKRNLLMESQRINMEDERRKQMFLKRTSEINTDLIPLDAIDNPSSDTHQDDPGLSEPPAALSPDLHLPETLESLARDVEHVEGGTSTRPTLYTIDEREGEAFYENSAT